MANARLYSAALLRDEHTKIVRRWRAIIRQYQGAYQQPILDFDRYLKRRRRDLDKLIAAAKKPAQAVREGN